MIRTQMRQVIKLIRKHPKMRQILRCESPYFHHWRTVNYVDHMLTFRAQIVLKHNRLNGAKINRNNDLAMMVISTG